MGLGFALAFGPRLAFAFAFGAVTLALSFPTLSLVVVVDPITTGPVGVGVAGALIFEVRWILSLAIVGERTITAPVGSGSTDTATILVLALAFG